MKTTEQKINLQLNMMVTNSLKPINHLMMTKPIQI